MSHIKNASKPQPRATIIDIARAAGVAPSTVSNALNGRRYVDAETGERIKQAALRLGYNPNRRAQRLRTGGADTIALFSSMPFAVAAGPSRLGFLMEIAAVAATAALESGMALVLVPPLEKALPPVEGLAIDGAIVIEPEAGDPTVARLRAGGLPVVSIGRQPGSEDTMSYVDLNSFASAALLLGHLAEEGCRNVAMVVGSARRNSYIEAEAAYARFAADRGMQPALLRIDETEGEDGARAAIGRLLEARPDLDGVCAPVDAFAVGAVRAAEAMGRSVPGGMKVVTRYDGLRARQNRPSLTALDLHLDAVAALAVDLLLRRVRGEAAPASLQGPMPILIPRESSVAANPPI